MRQEILDLLNDDNTPPLTYNEITNKVSKDSNDLNEIYQMIVLLENEHQIIRVKNDRLTTPKKLNSKVGQLEIKRKGFGFVRCEDEDIFVGYDNLNGAIHKDIVLIKLLPKSSRLNSEGVITQILENNNDLIVGEVIVVKNEYYVKPDDQLLQFEIKIPLKYRNNAVMGSKVLAFITTKSTDLKEVSGRIKQVIGHVNDVGIDILSVVYKYGFDPVFSKEVIKEAQSYDESDVAKEAINRTDLRNVMTITIDGADAKDLDDAISLEIDKDDNFVLYVSIADVSHYVTEKSKLDKKAFEHSTSVYLVDRVVPMLPHELSNGLCSLHPNVDRLTQTCKMTINKQGKVIDHEIFESVINSNYRMTYDDVNEIIMRDNKSLKEKYHEIDELLTNMYELSLIIRKERVKRGSLDFDVKEPKIIVDNKGKVIDIKARERYEAERIIEDFMIIANETVASHIYWQELPFIYRVHDEPNPDKITDFLKYASVFDIKFKKNSDNITSKDVQGLLDEIYKKEDTAILGRLLLRSMSKAKYAPDCIGHFGLASKFYTHFTSPIRRYPDLIVHRYLRKYVFNKKHPTANELDRIYTLMTKFGMQTSKKERDAIEAEREVNDMKMAEYMKDYVGSEFEGTISSITNFGMFVELDNTIEGLVHISNLKDDHYHYNAQYHSLIGERTNKQYKLGSKVKVIVEAVSVEHRQIDFLLVEKRR